MAGLLGSFSLATVSVTGGTPLTILQLVAPTNQRLKILGFDVSFDGTNSANTPALVQVLRQTTAGTATNTSVAPKKINDPSGTGETLQANSQNTFTVEPTAGDVLQQFNVPVFGGLFAYSYPPGQEEIVMGGTRLAWKVSAPQTVNVSITVRYEE